MSMIMHGVSMQDVRATALAKPEWLRSNPGEWALFIDIDGTLLDMAPVPDAVVVPAGLVETLGRLRQTFGGAVALSTGRRVLDADRLFAPLKLVTSGVHGTEVRSVLDGDITMLTPEVSPDLLQEVEQIARGWPGVLVERKGSGVAVHYRSVPDARPALERELRRIASHRDTLVLRPGRKVLEVIPKNHSKGAALAWLMRLAPFQGRRPIMIGDDHGDESALSMAQRLGGIGLTVAGEYFSAPASDFEGVATVRAWLAAAAGGPDAADAATAAMQAEV
jgi:trehalose 6-phosphate phosphatase